jgi:hypothetical protein
MLCVCTFLVIPSYIRGKHGVVVKDMSTLFAFGFWGVLYICVY